MGNHVSPYRNLASYQLQDAPLFYGRADAIYAVLEKCRTQAAKHRSFVLLHGACATGKSSLLHAGILPALLYGTRGGGDVDQWRYAQPQLEQTSSDLLASLANALLAESALPELADIGLNAHELTERMSKHAAGLADHLQEALRQADEAERRRRGWEFPVRLRLVLLLDPLDVVFSAAEAERDSFLATLGMLLDSQAWILATLRDESLPLAYGHPLLAELMADNGLYAVPAPDIEELAEMLCRPAQAAGLEFEIRDGKSLDAAILEDLAALPHPLPLLASVMDGLYQCAQRRSETTLHFDDYQSITNVWRNLADWFGDDAKAMQARKRLHHLADGWRKADNGRLYVACASDFEPEAKALATASQTQLDSDSRIFLGLAQHYARRQWWLRRVIAPLLAIGAALAIGGNSWWSYRQELRRTEEAANLTLQVLNRLNFELPGRIEHIPGALTALQETVEQTTPLLQRIDKLRGVADASLRLRATHLSKHGDQSSAQDDLPNALQNYRASLAAFAKLAAQDPDNAGWQRNLAVNYGRIGDVLLKQGDVLGALNNYSKSLGISAQLAAREPDNLAWKADLAFNHGMIAAALLQQGNNAGALEEFRQASRLLEPLIAREPEHKQWQKFLKLTKQGIAALDKSRPRKTSKKPG